MIYDYIKQEILRKYLNLKPQYLKVIINLNAQISMLKSDVEITILLS